MQELDEMYIYLKYKLLSCLAQFLEFHYVKH